MSRVAIPVTVIDPSGNAVNGASVEVRRRSDNALATIYQAETGSTTLANPVASNPAGRALGWLDRGAYKATISSTGITTYTENIDASPAADGAVDTPWIANDAVTEPKIPDLSWANATLTTNTTNPGGSGTPGYVKDHMGFVHLRGFVRNQVTVDNVVVFTLPAGARPTAPFQKGVRWWNGSSFGNGEVLIGTDGTVQFVRSNIFGWGALDGIVFAAF